MTVLHDWDSVLRKARAEPKEKDLSQTEFCDVRAGAEEISSFIMKTVFFEVGGEAEETAERRVPRVST